MAGLEAPTAHAKPVPVLTDDDLAALIKACSGKTFRDRRDEAVVRFLLGHRCAGLGAAACPSRTWTWTTRWPLVHGQGPQAPPGLHRRAHRPRAGPVPARGAQAPVGHLDALFLAERGALSPDGVRDLVRVRGERAGIPNVHPHRFRHSFAHDFLLNGGQERDLMRLAGWSSDVMLERYGASAADARAASAARKMKRGDRV